MTRSTRSKRLPISDQAQQVIALKTQAGRAMGGTGEDGLATLMARVDEAIAGRRFQQAIALADEMNALFDGHPDARFAKAKAELAGGDFQAALQVIGELLAVVDPAPAPLHLLHGNAQLASGNAPGAALAYRRSLERDPVQPLAYSHLAKALHMTDDMDAALMVLESAARRFPGSHEAWFELGAFQLERRQWDKARVCLERALGLNADHEPTLLALASANAELGRTEDAGRVLRTGLARPMGLPRRIREALLLPQIYAGPDDARQWRHRFQENLAALHRMQPDLLQQSAEVFDLVHVNFLLAYQGEHDRTLQEQYAQLLNGFIRAAQPDFLKPIAVRRHNRRIKVGFVSSMIRQCTVGHYFKHWIGGLDSGRFETHFIHLGDSPDAVTREVGSRCASFSVERGKVLEAARTIRQREWDILVYPELGMCGDTFLLSQLRLAPVQCCAWGHPVTTGSSMIDFYFTCADMEPEGHAEHYTESLLPLPGIGTCYEFPEAPPEIARTGLGLPENGRLYVCSQSLFKIHPDNDAVFLDIFESDEQAVLIFFQAESAEVTRQFAGRLQSALRMRGLPARNQIRFLPRMSALNFRAVLAAADVVLDTLHFSGGNTSLDALSVGAPLITLPGRFMRGRQSMSMLKKLGLDSLITDDIASYVSTACAVAAEPLRRQEIRKTCLEGRSEIFDRRDAIIALSDHLDRALERHVNLHGLRWTRIGGL
jgi:protein O-GlcNAc transferase